MKTETIARDSYGAITTHTGGLVDTPAPASYHRALDIVKQAVKTGKIPRSYDNIEWDRKRRADGTALHHELYDFAAGAALICIRRSQGNGKYGVSTTSKNYYIITRSNGKITISEADKNRAAKLAKSGLPWGGVIAALTGKKPAKIKTAPMHTEHGYKLLRVNEDGTLSSVWDGSPWTIGKRRAERAEDDHNGGLYYYRNLNECLEAAHNNSVFAADMQHHRLAIVTVKAQGQPVKYHSGKLAATYITPLEMIGMTI